MAEDNWIKAEGNAIHNFDEEPTLIGTYIRKEENTGPNASNLYTLEKTDGGYISVWGNTILDNRFEIVNLGEEVKIVYYGKVKS